MSAVRPMSISVTQKQPSAQRLPSTAPRAQKPAASALHEVLGQALRVADEMDEINRKKEGEIQAMEGRVERRDAEIAMLKDRVGRRETEIGSLQAKREEARLLHDSELKSGLEKLESELKTVVEKGESELKTVESELKKREVEIAKREADIAKRDSETTKLKEKLGCAEADNKALASKLKAATAEAKAATSEANKRVSKQESELKALGAKRDAEAKKVEKREQALSKTEQKNKDLVAEVKTLSEARSSLETVVNDQELAFRANESAVQHEVQAVVRYYEQGAEASLSVGTKVRVAGVASSDMNGREGVITEIFDGRCVVNLGNTHKASFKPVNLEPATGAVISSKAIAQGVYALEHQLRKMCVDLDHAKEMRNKEAKARHDDNSKLKDENRQMRRNLESLQKKHGSPGSAGHTIAEFDDDEVVRRMVEIMIKDVDGDPAKIKKLKFCMHPDKNPCNFATTMMHALGEIPETRRRSIF